MKLLNTIKKIILETRKFPKLKFSDKVDGKDTKLFSSFHQWFDRHGDDDYETIKNIFFSKSNKYRVGVPDEIIIKLFLKNFKKIEKSFDDFGKSRIIFVKERKENEDEVDFDFIEFILEKNNNSYDIITSAYSKDGKFLVLGYPVKTPWVMIENIIKLKYDVVYLD